MGPQLACAGREHDRGQRSLPAGEGTDAKHRDTVVERDPARCSGGSNGGR